MGFAFRSAHLTHCSTISNQPPDQRQVDGDIERELSVATALECNAAWPQPGWNRYAHHTKPDHPEDEAAVVRGESEHDGEKTQPLDQIASVPARSGRQEACISPAAEVPLPMVGAVCARGELDRDRLTPAVPRETEQGADRALDRAYAPFDVSATGDANCQAAVNGTNLRRQPDKVLAKNARHRRNARAVGHGAGFATISQTIAMTAMKAGQPSRNQARMAR